VPSRARVDACPGALQMHQAADGGLVRVRILGGALAAQQLRALAQAAQNLGDGFLELTSRGNVQLRGLPEGVEHDLASRLANAGLLPSRSHERVRNILCSPLSGRHGGRADMRALVTEFDEQLCAAPELASLPGRFLATVDDGSGDVSGLGADVGVHAVSRSEVALILAGTDSGRRVPTANAATALIAAAQAFQQIRGEHWRLAEVPNGVHQVLAASGAVANERVDVQPRMRGPVGWIDQDDGAVALAATIPLGRLSAQQATLLAVVDAPLVLTPWRSLVVCDLPADVAEHLVGMLAANGLVFDEASPWLRVSACAGSPGCAKSLADVRTDLAAAVRDDQLPVVGQQHWVGCERRCGRPVGAVTDVVATANGYRVDQSAR
jgi:precorrin-3B synthase